MRVERTNGQGSDRCLAVVVEADLFLEILVEIFERTEQPEWIEAFQDKDVRPTVSSLEGRTVVQGPKRIARYSVRLRSEDLVGPALKSNRLKNNT